MGFHSSNFGHQIIDPEAQQGRQRDILAIMEEFPPQKIFNFDESKYLKLV